MHPDGNELLRGMGGKVVAGIRGWLLSFSGTLILTEELKWGGCMLGIGSVC